MVLTMPVLLNTFQTSSAAGDGIGANFTQKIITGSHISTQKLAVAGTALTWTNLDINEAGYYIIHYNLKNAEAPSVALKIYVNGDTVNTNYNRQRLQATGATLTASRNDNPGIGTIAGSDQCSGILHVHRDVDGTARITSMINTDVTTAVIMETAAITTASTVTNITKLELSLGGTDQFATNSTASLYTRKKII